MKDGVQLDYLISASTDIGLVKNTNQDSFGVKVMDTRIGKVVMAVLCDGMGGYAKGEVASATVVNTFSKWLVNDFSLLCNSDITDSVIRREWDKIVQECNEKIQEYGAANGISLGTTLTAIMLTDTRYFIINVGDSRVYKISDSVTVLTQDQTVVAQEIAMGRLTEEQAENDPRRSVLLQCIGASDVVIPDISMGETEKDAVYMLCSDGFRHEISNDEIYTYLNPDIMTSEAQMKQNMDYLIETDKMRQERDNISVVSIRTY